MRRSFILPSRLGLGSACTLLAAQHRRSHARAPLQWSARLPSVQTSRLKRFVICWPIIP